MSHIASAWLLGCSQLAGWLAILVRCLTACVAFSKSAAKGRAALMLLVQGGADFDITSVCAPSADRFVTPASLVPALVLQPVFGLRFCM
jgi:hypothetical protein